MPNWKKLIVSGSDASLNSLNVTQNVTAQSFTGSFTGSFTAPGATTQVVYNNNGVLSANSGFVYSGSYVGIGTTNPAYLLDVAGVGNFRNIGAQLVLNGGFGAYEFATTTGNAFTISLSGTAERMRILSDGNVGINTLSPGDKLEVVGNVYADAFNSVGTLSRYNSTGGIAIAGLAGNPYAYISAYVNGGGAGKNLVLQPSNGSVGIGTTNPTATLEVSGNVKAVSFTGSFSGSINTAVSASYALSSSYALTATTASYALNALSSSYALSGSYSNFALTASYALNAADSVWTGSGTDIYYNQGNVGIGVTNPSERLHVSGAVRLNDVYFKSNNPASYPNFSIGNGNYTSTVTGYGNIAFGYETLYSLTSGRYNVGIGYRALVNSTTGESNVALGPYAMQQNVAGSDNVALGSDALTRNSSGTYNVAIGNSTLAYNDNGTENIGIGEGAVLSNKHGNYNIGMGYYALNYLTNTTSSYNIGIGYLSGGNLAGGIHNTYLGNNLHVVSTGSYNVFIGGNIAVNALGFSSATNTVVIADNSGNVKLLANSVGNVGIGTTNPTVKLQVDNNSHNYIQVNSSVANVQTAINVTNSSSTSRATLSWEDGTRGAYADLYSSTYLSITTQSSEKMRITAGGSVGIGTTSPSDKLTVAVGNVEGIRVQSSNSGFLEVGKTGGARWRWANDYNNSNLLELLVNDLAGSAPLQNVLTINGSNGYVGIGAISPLSKLHVRAATNQNFRISAGTNLEVASIDDADSIYVPLTFRASRFDFQNGNVGIGTTSPSSKLEVYTATGDTKLTVTTTGGNSYVPRLSLDKRGDSAWNISSPAGGFNFAIDQDGSTRLWIASGTGNVGIGTTNPSSALDAIVSSGGTSGLRFRGYSDSGTPYLLSLGTYSYPDQFQIKSVNGLVTMGIVGNTGANPDLAFQTNTTERMRITTGGNVGIGTTNPGTRLQVLNTASPYQISVKSDTSKVWSMGVGISGYYQEWFLLNDGSTDIFKINAGYTEITNNLYASANVGIGTGSPTQKLDVAGAISVSGSVIDYEVAPALIGPGPAVNIVSFVPGTTKAAFVDYVIVDSSGATNQRVGTIMVSINLNTVSAVLNEVTTVDIGNTSAITFAVAYGAPTWLTATNSGITPYDISYMVRYF